ncbi:MAG: HVO_0476 family zinc finger protein, partial [Candidatus Thermoplasmatota archaeon]|nr:HVO_0476 family zinc finger protein [Candidatus Thermoplasmatota archaeon]
MLCGAIIMASELGSNRVESLCGNCQEGTDHQVLRERSVGDGTDLLLKCSVCGVVVTHEIRSSKAVKIP